MKKIIALMLVLVFAFAFVGCNKEPAHDHNHDHNHTTEIASNTEPVTKSVDKAPAFSYAEDEKAISKQTTGVKTEGFKNTKNASIGTVEEAITLAQKEKNIESDSVNMFYDAETKICKVIFYTEGAQDEIQTVYLDKDGKTILIVYGE